MNNYGKALGDDVAKVLPATGAGLLLIDASNPILLAGFVAVSIISFVAATAYLSRYLINR